MKRSELEKTVKETKREYYREYRRKNKARIAENNKRYWERKAEKKLQAEGKA
ncbi:MAG: phosphatase [Clostridia bacterium]|nr:phosphatase [Clostridia bacterium]